MLSELLNSYFYPLAIPLIEALWEREVSLLRSDLALVRDIEWEIYDPKQVEERYQFVNFFANRTLPPEVLLTLDTEQLFKAVPFAYLLEALRRPERNYG